MGGRLGMGARGEGGGPCGLGVPRVVAGRFPNGGHIDVLLQARWPFPRSVPNGAVTQWGIAQLRVRTRNHGSLVRDPPPTMQHCSRVTRPSTMQDQACIPSHDTYPFRI